MKARYLGISVTAVLAVVLLTFSVRPLSGHILPLDAIEGGVEALEVATLAAIASGNLRKQLTKKLNAAEDRIGEAGNHLDRGKIKTARKDLKKAGRELRKYRKKLRKNLQKERLPPSVSQPLIADATVLIGAIKAYLRGVLGDNEPPVADAGPDQAVALGALVNLDGTGSTDPDGDALTYRWQVADPDGAGISLLEPTSLAPSFPVEKPGTYIVELTVSDGQETSAPDRALISTSNTAPVAHAGQNQSAPVGAAITLDGSASSDTDGDALNFFWTLPLSPGGSFAVLDDPARVNPQFTLDVAGDYQAQLIVNDGTTESTPDIVDISTENSAPLADAGPDQAILVGETVTLDGSGSSDVDGDPLYFEWSLIGAPRGSRATVSDAMAVRPRITADLPGVYVVQLIVDDDDLPSAPATVVLSTQNRPPVADAGPDQLVPLGVSVTMNGTASSDPDGDALGHFWSLLSVPSGSTTLLLDSDTAMPAFVADRPGNYAAQLIVADGQFQSAPDVVVITTENTRPVADAGPDQTAFVGQEVFLDGSGSGDADGDPLTFSWSLITAPEGSLVVLDDPIAVAPSVTVDRKGDFVGQLIVNDGELSSVPDSAVVSVLNRAPSVLIEPIVRTWFVGDAIWVTASAVDLDDDPLALSWQLPIVPAGSSATITATGPSESVFTADVPGNYSVQVTAYDGDALARDSIAINVRPPNTTPVANAGSDLVVPIGGGVGLDGSGSFDADGDGLSYDWKLVSTPSGSSSLLVDPESPTPGLTADKAGTYIVELVVHDGFAASAPDQLVITTANTAPVAALVPSALDVVTTTTVSFDGSGSIDADGDDLAYSWDLVSAPTESVETLVGGTGVSNALTPLIAGDYLIQLSVSDGELVSTAEVHIHVSDPALPPDPSTVATAADHTRQTNLYLDSAFLYNGTNPIQTGMEPASIDAERVSVLHGRVTRRDGSPLPAVRVSVHNHPEYGQTLSRADGAYDLVINGGAVPILSFKKPGYLAAQRLVKTRWEQHAYVDDVALVSLDPNATVAEIGASTYQTARGSVESDSDGTRQATLLLPPGTMATMRLSDGQTVPMESLTIRATEFTVGPNGPSAMPGPLPTFSGYTYAVELSVDEAVAAGATRVDFNQPLPFYVENFLGFPVGEIVPLGWYDREKAAWIAADNGRVIAVLGTDPDGRATLDIEGFGIAATTDGLAVLGITDAEREQIASLYAPGKTLWRVELDHFTPWDCNWPYGPPPDAIYPDQPQPGTEKPLNDPSCERGSVIECENQALREVIPIAGTGINLNYHSRRQHTDGPTNVVIPLTGSAYPPSLAKVELRILIGGRQYRYEFEPAPDLSYTFAWDGRDVLGRDMYGYALAQIEVRYQYAVVLYSSSGAAGRAFGKPSAGGTVFDVIGTRGESTVNLVAKYDFPVVNQYPVGPVADWTLDPHHALVRGQSQRLLLGDGTTASAHGLGGALNELPHNGDGQLGGGQIAFDSAGRLYTENNSIVASPDGTHTDLALKSALGAQFGVGRLSGLAIGPDDTLYVGGHYEWARPNGGVFRVSVTGEITRLSSKNVFNGGLDVDDDGTVYFITENNVYSITPDGTQTLIAGGGSDLGDGVLATAANIFWPYDMVVGPEGAIYLITDQGTRIRRIDRSRRIVTVAGQRGSPGTGAEGDGGLATIASIFAYFLMVDRSDGTIYFHGKKSIRRITPDGVIDTIVGNPLLPTAAQPLDGSPARAIGLTVSYAGGLALDPSGQLVSTLNSGTGYPTRACTVASPLKGAGAGEDIIASTDASELYVFESSGRHLRTVHASTGAERIAFAYDPAGELVSIRDAENNTVIIERDPNGSPIAIVAPDGQRTGLETNGEGRLVRVTNPEGESWNMAYSTEGLLTRFEKPRGFASTFQYDDSGRLLRDENAAGGFWNLDRTGTENDFTVAMSSALGRTTAHHISRDDIDRVTRTTTHPDGTHTQSFQDGRLYRETITPDGTRIEASSWPDPRFGLQSPVPSKTTIRLPSGLTSVTSMTRTLDLVDPTDLLSLQWLNDATTINGRLFNSRYDAASRTKTTTSPAGRTATVTIDTQGRVTRETTPGLAETRYQYDPRGRLTEIIEDDGTQPRLTRFSYSTDGYLETITDPLERITRLDRDSVGRVLVQQRPDGEHTGFRYDPNSNTTGITPPGRREHQFDFDEVDLETRYHPPSTAEVPDPDTAQQYNLDQQLTHTERPDGQSLRYDYDTAGRLAFLTVPDGTRSWHYAPTTGQLDQIVDTTGATLDYTYDGFLPLSETWTGSVSGRVAHGYDANLRITTQRINATHTISYGYDADDLLTQAGALSLSRDPQHGLLTATTLGTVSTQMAYNAFAEPISDTARINTAPVYDITYTRDKLGRITEKTELIQGSALTTAYNYDLAGRLETVHINGILTEHYTYDPNGNRLSRTTAGGTDTGTYDDQDRLQTYGEHTYTYNAHGDLQTKTHTPSGQTTDYQYDVFGNLQQVNLPTDAAIAYQTDARNRRIARTHNGEITHRWLYQDQLNPVAELDETGSVITRYVYAEKANVPAYLIKIDPTTQTEITYRIVSDHLGSPRLIINTDTGQIAQRMDYDAWGNITLDTNPGFQPFGFAGGLYDPQTQLTRFGARDYDPSIGRWTLKDPMKLDDGSNVYSYVAGNPVGRTDVTGLFWSNHHYSLSYFSTASSGLSTSDSMMVAAYSVTADIGTQGIEDAHKHSMTRSGGSHAESRRDRNRFIVDQLRAGTLEGLGNALHAAQDEFAQGHQFIEYDGTVDAAHMWLDALPSGSTYWQAFERSLLLVDIWQYYQENRTFPWERAQCGPY